jgi:ribosomal subunit interface protein
MENKININFIGMAATDALTEYAEAKLTKHAEITDSIVSIDVYLKQLVHSKGVSQDFVCEISANVPKSRIHVTEKGDDMYALIDKASDMLFRRLRRYLDKRHNWEGTQPWSVLEAADEMSEMTDEVQADLDNYADYTPQVFERVDMDNTSPMDEAEAIEQMALGGRSEYLFKRTDGKWCMVYTLPGGGFGVVAQGEDKAL